MFKSLFTKQKQINPFMVDGMNVAPGKIRVVNDEQNAAIPSEWKQLDQCSKYQRLQMLNQCICDHNDAIHDHDFDKVQKLTFKINALVGSLTIKKQFYAQ